MKETQETKSRVNFSGSMRVLRSSNECNIGWSGSTQTNYNGMLAYCAMSNVYLLLSILMVHILHF